MAHTSAHSAEQFIPAQVEEQLEYLRENFGDVDERVRSAVRERPIVAVLVAVATGYFIGRLIARR